MIQCWQSCENKVRCIAPGGR